MKQITIFILLFLAVIVSGCFHELRYTNNYRKLLRPKPASKSDSIVTIDFESRPYSYSSKSPSLKTIFELPEKAQKELIKAYADKDTTSELLRQSLIKPLEKAKSKPEKVFNERFINISRRFSFNVSDNWKPKYPSSRIENIRIDVELKSDVVRFSDFIDFQTKYETFDVGAVSRTSSKSFSVSANASLGVEDTISKSLGAEATYGNSSSTTENVQLSRRFVGQSGFITDKHFVLYMEGMPRHNLNGLYSVAVNMNYASNGELETHDFVLFSINKKKEGELTEKILVIPPLLDTLEDVVADVSISYLYRNVVGKGKYSIEGEHKIRYYDIQDVKYKDRRVFYSDDFSTTLIDIKCGGERVFIQTPDSVRHELTFLSKGEAYSFRQYLEKNKTDKVGDYQLVYKSGENFIPVGDSTLGINVRELY